MWKISRCLAENRYCRSEGRIGFRRFWAPRIAQAIYILADVQFRSLYSLFGNRRGASERVIACDVLSRQSGQEAPSNKGTAQTSVRTCRRSQELNLEHRLGRHHDVLSIKAPHGTVPGDAFPNAGLRVTQSHPPLSRHNHHAQLLRRRRKSDAEAGRLIAIQRPTSRFGYNPPFTYVVMPNDQAGCETA